MLHETEYTLINQLLSINYIPTTIFFVYQRYDFESKTQFVNRFLGDLDLYDWKNVNRYKLFVEQYTYDRWSFLRFTDDCQSFNLTTSDVQCNARFEFSIFLSPFYVLALFVVSPLQTCPNPTLEKLQLDLADWPRVDHKPAKITLCATVYGYAPLPANQ